MSTLRTFIVKFKNNDNSNGFALIVANSMNLASTIFKELSIAATTKGATIITALDSPYGTDYCNTEIIAECVSSVGLSAYLVAVKNGYKGTEELWTKEIIELKTIDPATEEEIGEIVV